jgi:uncharacterized protein
MKLNLLNDSFDLLPEKAIYSVEKKMLVLSDLHLGKAMHFRKNGIAIPQESSKKDYAVLIDLIAKHNPEKVILLGDLFHSAYNSEWSLFCDFINIHSAIEFTLVIGNHDILQKELYNDLKIAVVRESMELDSIIFSHEPMLEVPIGKINIAGHIHPGVILYGMGKQKIRLACFYFNEDQLILPAFGRLTGLQLINPEKDSKVFAVVNNKVMLI